MSQPYVGEVRLVGFNFAPAGWNYCDGSLQSISQYETLYNLIGTTYGGDGQQTFGLPNLLGRIPIHAGSNGTNNYVIGQTGGVENVTLSLSQYPSHDHSLMASTNTGGSNNPSNQVVNQGLTVYSTSAPVNPMLPAMVGSSGGNQPHNNLQPYLALNWIISFYGVYPSQN
jgi:microcystin-dependent protein